MSATASSFFTPSGGSWRPPLRQPLLGPRAEDDLRAIRKRDRRLGRRLTRRIVHLLDRPVAREVMGVPDPPGVGPRFTYDLGDGYAAILWVLFPSAGMPSADGAIWIERVIAWSELDAAIGEASP